MKIFLQAWNNFKSQPDIWFFYAFLATLTLTIRKVIIDYPIAGQFNEWAGIYIYLSDIFLILTLLAWLFILRNIYRTLSTNSFKLWLIEATVNLPLILVIWSFTSILWAENQNIALFKAIKLFELCFLYLYLIFRVILRPEVLKNIFRIIITLGFIQAIFGIWQFIIQHSIGLFWLKESLISPNMDGVAKIVFHGDKFIRAYGLFPHPNILGGFLLISIILTLAYKKMFHPSRNVPHETSYGTSIEHFSPCHSERIRQLAEKSKNLINIIIYKLDPSTALGMTLLLVIQIIALILTFSKSAILGLLIAACYISWKNKQMFHPRRNVPRGTSYGAGMEHLKVAILAGLIILILGLYLNGLNLGDNLGKAISDRVSQLEIWKTIVSQINLLIGSGASSYMFHVEQMFPKLEAWQYQPIHNVYLLVLSELGFVGLFIFAFFLCKLIKKSPSPLQGEGWGEVFKGILFGFVFIMLFDHYLWDIQQGQIMLWLILGLLAGFQLQSHLSQSNPK
jgi:hypothetical protein